MCWSLSLRKNVSLPASASEAPPSWRPAQSLHPRATHTGRRSWLNTLPLAPPLLGCEPPWAWQVPGPHASCSFRGAGLLKGRGGPGAGETPPTGPAVANCGCPGQCAAEFWLLGSGRGREDGGTWQRFCLSEPQAAGEA